METETVVVECKKCHKRYIPAGGKKDYFFATHDSNHNGRCWDCLSPEEKGKTGLTKQTPPGSE